jgi:hypothetical protein
VPPEVLFRGMNRSYKSPEIIKVPSCREHNEGASHDDELLAWVISDAASAGGTAGFDVFQALLAPVRDRIYSNRTFADARLQRIGVRVFLDPKDYDENGSPKRRVYDGEYFRRSEESLRERCMIVQRSLRKIAAGLFFHATNCCLGPETANSLEIVVPTFKQIGETINHAEAAMDETTFFSSKVTPRDIVSGSPEVFKYTLAQRSGSKHLEMRLLFYDSIDVWIRTRARP